MEFIEINILILPCIPQIEKICSECDKILMQSKKTNVNLLFSWN